MLKTLRASSKGKTQKGQHLLVVGVGRLSIVSESDTRRCKRLSPGGGGHDAVCQQGRWALKGGGL